MDMQRIVAFLKDIDVLLLSESDLI
jgi:hypothetical protein